MKKFICLFMCLGLFFAFNTYVKASGVTITKENLTKALEDLKNYEETASSSTTTSNTSSTIDTSKKISSYSITDTNITINNADGTTCSFNYSIDGNKIRFYYTYDVKQGESYANYKEKTDNLLSGMYGYILVANIEGASFEDAAYYALMSLVQALLGQSGEVSSSSTYTILDDTKSSNGITLNNTDSKTIKVSEFPTRVMEYVNSIYSDANPNPAYDENKTFSVQTTKTNLTSTSCTLTGNIVAYSDADYSKLKGTANSFKQSTNTTNTTNTANTANTSAESSTTTYENPNTGSFLNIFLTIMGILLLIFFLLFIKRKNKFFKI